MKVSIICAAFRAELLNRVLESVKKQTHKEWELIFVNDNQDGVREWWKKFILTDYYNQNKDRIFFVDVGINKGRFGLFTRNIGVMASRYDHLVFLDDDNEWEPNHLETLVSLKKETGKHPYCWLHIKGKKDDSNVDRVKKTAFIRQHIDLGCLLYERVWFDRYGGFRDDSQVSFDWNHLARIHFGEGPYNFVCTEQPSLVFWHKRY